jgi:hypothetical protein
MYRLAGAPCKRARAPIGAALRGIFTSTRPRG